MCKGLIGSLLRRYLCETRIIRIIRWESITFASHSRFSRSKLEFCKDDTYVRQELSLPKDGSRSPAPLPVAVSGPHWIAVDECKFRLLLFISYSYHEMRIVTSHNSKRSNPTLDLQSSRRSSLIF